jgi:hypothetical protein
MMRGGRNSPIPAKFVDPFNSEASARDLGRTLGPKGLPPRGSGRRQPRALKFGRPSTSSGPEFIEGLTIHRTILSKVGGYAGESKG